MEKTRRKPWPDFMYRSRIAAAEDKKWLDIARVLFLLKFEGRGERERFVTAY